MINRYFSFLRHVLVLAIKEGWISRNLVSGIRFFLEANRTTREPLSVGWGK